MEHPVDLSKLDTKGLHPLTAVSIQLYKLEILLAAYKWACARGYAGIVTEDQHL